MRSFRTLSALFAVLAVLTYGPAAHAATIDGTSGDDDLFGTNSDDTIQGFGGNDYEFGKKGNDIVSDISGGGSYLFGGSGFDRVISYASFANIYDDDGKKGDEKGDRLKTNDGIDSIYSIDGEVDKIFCGDGGDEVYADKSDIVADDCEDVYNENTDLPGQLFVGGAGNDVVMGDNDFQRIFGKNGNDRLNGGGETDYLFGGRGKDTLSGDNGIDLLVDDDGEAGDLLKGGNDGDQIYSADGAIDYVDCGDGVDEVYVDGSDNTLLNCETVHIL
jgi:Ca2+-binding RTX toxin-like protein